MLSQLIQTGQIVTSSITVGERLRPLSYTFREDEMVNYLKYAPLTKSGSQTLGSGAMSLATAFARLWIFDFLMIKFSAACSQTVTVKIDNAEGVNYDAVFESTGLGAVTSYTYRPTGAPVLLVKGDEIIVGITSGGSTTAYATIRGHEA